MASAPTALAPEEPRFYDFPEDGEDEGDEEDSDYEPDEDDGYEEEQVEEEMPDTAPSFFIEQTRQLRAGLGDGDLCQKVNAVLMAMDSAHINLPIFLDALSWGDAACIKDAKIRSARTSLMQSKELPLILRHWWKPPNTSHKTRPKGGRDALSAFAAEATRWTIDRELMALKPILSSPAGQDIDEEELTGTSLEQLATQIHATAPHLWTLVHGMAQSSKQQQNVHKSPSRVVLATIAILSYSRSHHRNRLQKLFSIYFKFRGLSAKGFDTLHALGITMSNKWTGNAVGRISTRAMDTVVGLMKMYPWLLSYDNATISFRVFSQRIDHQTEFGNGTAATVYIARNARPLSSTANADFQRQRKAGMENPISVLDLIDMSLENAPRVIPHFDYQILRVLLESPDFHLSEYRGNGHHALSHPERLHGLPWGRACITLQYLLGTVGIPEASYEDNVKLIDEWLKQLRMDDPEMYRVLGLERLQFWVGDQLTVDRLRNIINFRSEDFNSFLRLDWMVPSPGWLHIMMCIANSIHKQHLGTGLGRGLSAICDLLQRKGLGKAQTKGVFYHDLDELLAIVFDAQIRELWLEVSEAHSLGDLRKKTPEELVQLASQIRSRHASTEALNQMQKDDHLFPERHDEIKFQSVLFLRDVLQYVSLRSAIKHGDVGFMQAMLPELAYRFAGGKNSNYFGEVLELIQGLKREWPDEIRDFIINNCWLVNFAGRQNTFLGVDMAQEHNIKDIKVTHRSQGPNVDWRYIHKLHPAIHLIRGVADFMEKEFGTDTRGKKHTIPKRENDITELQRWYRASRVHKLIPGRTIASSSPKDLTKDYIKIGQELLVSRDKIAKWVENRDYARSSEQDWAEFGENSDNE